MSPDHETISPLRLLLLEDNPSDAELVVAELRRAGLVFEFKVAGTKAAYLEYLDSSFDAIVSDYDLPQFNARQALVLLQERKLDIPFLVVSGTMGEDTAVELMKLGAADYLLKDRLARLPQALVHAVKDQRLRRERIAVQEQLRESEERMRAILESALDAVVTMNHAGDIVEFNPASEKMFGFSREKAIGAHLVDLIIPERLRADHNRGLELYLETGEARMLGRRVDVIALRCDGSEFPAEMAVMRIGSREPPMFTAFVRDIGEKLRAEKTVRDSKERLQTIIANLSEGLIISDLEGELLDWNPAALRMHGLSSAEQSRFRLADYAREFELSTLDGTFLPLEEWPLSRIIRHEPVGNFEARIRRAGAAWERVFSFGGTTVNDAVLGELAFVTIKDITERRRAEERIGEQANIINLAHDAILIQSLEGRIEFWNKGAERLYGWTAGEIEGRSVQDLLYDSPQDYLLAKEQLMERGEWVGELEQLCKSGEHVIIDAHWTLIRDENGQPKAVLAINTDVTQRKQADESVRRQDGQYRILFASHPNPTWVYNSDTLAFLAVNDAAVEHYGYPREEFLSMNLRDIRPVEDIPKLLETTQSRTDETRHVGVWRHCKKNGELIFADIYTSPTQFENRPACLAIAIDVTDREHTQARLRDQADIINRAHDAIIVSDFATNHITFWNAGAQRLYGWTTEEAAGRSIAELIFAHATDAGAISNGLASTGEFRGELRQVAKDKRELVVDGRATLVRDATGSPQSVLNINTDVTEHKKLETQLLRAQRLESIGTLASGVAHDLNNILAPILMGAAVLRRGEMAADDEAILSTIEICAQRGADIVKQVLTFARGAEGERIQIRAALLLKDVAKIAQETFPKKITVRTSFVESIWCIQGDPTQLHQVLLNLCVNARDAMPAGGTLCLSAENFPVDEHYASMTPGAKAGPHVRFEVTDTGMGIPPENLNKIFDPFFTTKELGHGTGLGLSSVIGIVKSHGGFMSVYSEIGRGTTFKIFIPATIGELEALEETNPVSPRATGELLLLVDDEKTILQVAKALLEAHGYRVMTAEDATAALAIFAMQKDEIELVLTDLAMPLMDGIALIRTLQKMKPDVRVIASTGRGGQEQHAHELESLHVGACLTKPYNKNKLLNTLHEALTHRNGSI